MRRKKIIVILTLILLVIVIGSSFASGLPTFDAVNAALNEIRNVLMESQFAQDIALAAERLEQLKAQYLEAIRFNSGFDDFFQVFSGDAIKKLYNSGNNSLQNAFVDFGWVSPHVEMIKNSSDAGNIRYALEKITGEIPRSEDRPYIPFEEMHVVESFQLAQEIRNAGNETRSAAISIAEQAKTASPKGAARLQTEALSQVMLLTQQNQETMAKLLELEAVQVEQVSRDEKRLENERLKYLDDAENYLETVLEGNYGN